MAQNKRKPKGKDPSERIGRLDNHVIGYYRRVSTSLVEDCHNEEDRDLLLENVFKQLSTEALSVSRNQTVSTIVEGLLPQASPGQLCDFTAALAEDWETACEDRFASHVTQTLLLCMQPHLCPEEMSSDKAGALLEHFMKLVRILLGNLAVFMHDVYASHIVRVVMEVLAGQRVSEDVIKSKLVRSKQKSVQEKSVLHSTLPSTFSTLLKEFTGKIVGMKMLKGHAEDAVANPVIQTAVLITQSCDSGSLDDVCRTVMHNTQMTEAEGSDSCLPGIVTNQIGSWLVEQLIRVSSDAVYDEILELAMCQEAGIEQMANHPLANFVLQALISRASNKDQFLHFYKILVPFLERTLANNHMGVIHKLAEGCLKHGAKQKKLLKALMEAFHCHTPAERQLKFVTLVAGLQTYDVFYKIEEKNVDSDKNDDSDDDDEDYLEQPMLRQINLHGSILLQSLLKFGNPHVVVSSLLDLKASELRLLACDPKGSHIIDAAFKSDTIGEKTKGQLISKYKGFLTDLACHRSGSRVVETMWQCSGLQQRTVMAEELSKHADRLQGDRTGRFVWRSCALHHFRNRPADWRAIQTGEVKKRQLFQDLLPEIGTEPPAKKKIIEKDESDEKDDVDNEGDEGPRKSTHKRPAEETDIASHMEKKKKKKKKKKDSSGS